MASFTPSGIPGLSSEVPSTSGPPSSDHYPLDDDVFHEGLWGSARLMADVVASNAPCHDLSMELYGTPHKRHTNHNKEFKFVEATGSEGWHAEVKSSVAVGLLIKVKDGAVGTLPSELGLSLQFAKDSLKDEKIMPCEKHRDHLTVLDRYNNRDNTMSVDSEKHVLKLFTGGKSVAQFSITFRCLSSDGTGNEHDRRLWKMVLTDPKQVDRGAIFQYPIKVKAEIKFPELGGSGRKRPMRPSATATSTTPSIAPTVTPVAVTAAAPLGDANDDLEQRHYETFMQKIEKEGAEAAFYFARSLPQKPESWRLTKKIKKE